MKLTGLIGIMILVTIIFYSWGYIADDFETNYLDTNISSAEHINDSYKSSYNRREDLNKTFAPLQKGFEDISEDSGWFDKVGDTAIAIPKVIISIPGMIIATLYYALTDTKTILNEIGIPTEIVLLTTFAILIFFLFKIVAMWRRYEA